MKWLILLVLLTSVKSYAIGEANNEYYYDFCIKKKKKSCINTQMLQTSEKIKFLNHCY